MNVNLIKDQILNIKDEDFEETAIQIFKYQYANIPVYKNYTDVLKIDVTQVRSLLQIPFLPVQFFKTHNVISENALVDKENLTLFESSGTSTQINSRHFVKDTELYEHSFMTCFRNFFGNISNYCILGLLPSYLEKGNSSLVYMIHTLIKKSTHPQSGFYLNNFHELHNVLSDLERKKQAVILFGVTYALLDFAAQFPFKLNHTTIIETGGMKGRRKEISREEVHAILQEAFSVRDIFSEYGMTELLSQAYSTGNGIFKTPAWMKVLIRDINDPFEIMKQGRGVLNIIDLANIHSCSFIATDDLGDIFDDGSFSVKGRLDLADLRGCSLLLEN